MSERSKLGVSEERSIYDPIGVQLESLSPLANGEITIDDLCTPTSVRLLVEQRFVNLVQLRSLSEDFARLNVENRALTDQCSELRVKAAKSTERDLMSWIEIPVSALLGFATSMALDPTTRGEGFTIVVIAMVVLLFVRMSHIVDLAKLVSRKEPVNAHD